MPWNAYSLGIWPDGKIVFFPPFVFTLVWWLFWKGLALYRSARNGQKGWFILLLVMQTLGILDIIYLLFFSKPPAIVKKKSNS